MELNGKVTSGKNDFAGLVNSPWQAFYNLKTKLDLKKGSLNLELQNEISFNEPRYEIYKYKDTPDGRYVYLVPCKVSKDGFSKDAFIQRIQNVEERDRKYHPMSIIEIISDIHFKESWNINDGDNVKIIFI